MAKRHQSRRRRAYGPRLHELRERRSRHRGEDVRSWSALARGPEDAFLRQAGESVVPPIWTGGHEAVGVRVAD